MKHCFFLVRRSFRIVVLSLLFLVLSYGWVQAQIGVEVVNFFSNNSTLFGTPVPPGAVIRAFAPGGVQCGEFTVAQAGKYGLMPCRRDDPFTPGDDGANPGDVISFTINGFPATPVPRSLNGVPVPAGTPVTWTENGDRWEVDLHVATPAGARPVGGYGEPLSRLELLGPWILLILGGAMGVILSMAFGRRVT